MSLPRRLFALLWLLAPVALPVAAHAQTAPIFAVVPNQSSVKFFVSATMSVSGTFDKWNASLTFASADASTGVLDIKIQADSVDTGSGLKNNKLKGDDFFAVDKYPQMTFHSTKITKTGANTFDVDGKFTIRGVTKQEKLTLTVSGIGTGTGDIKGTVAFNRKDYGINGEIPFMRIADRVEVTIDLKATRTSGPPLTFTK